jgi:hypothetical protein
MADNSRTSRAIWYDASAELTLAGYHCIRVAGASRPFDLVAWKDGKFLFIVVRRARSKGVFRFSDEIACLARLVETRTLPGIAYLWIFLSKTWFRYQILPGGAMRIRGTGI